VIVLALDTTTRAGSVAVVIDRQIAFELVGDATLTHGQRLPGDLRQALDAASLALPDIDLLAVAAGPGSFTGLRVGIAAMQGLAIATGRRIVAVSALDALARAARPEPNSQPIAAWMDAQRGQVFAALYDSSGRRVVIEPSVARPDVALGAWTQLAALTSVRFIGDGAVRHADTIRARLGNEAIIEQPPPLAGIIGLMAAAAPERAVLPHAVVPIYIRRPDAELARLERARES
jgi:tRNA threonylcarbamoyladenosine biosynthesis protein TsaB